MYTYHIHIRKIAKARLTKPWRSEVEVTGFEPVSKHILQKLSTCLFCFEVFREATGNKQPITSLAAFPIAIGT